MSAPPPRGRPTLRAVWNLRVLGLFLVGPVVGVALVGAVFGLPPGLVPVAGAMFLLGLALFGILVRGETRRLSHPASRR